MEEIAFLRDLRKNQEQKIAFLHMLQNANIPSVNSMSSPFFLDTQTSGFMKLNFHFPRENALKIFSRFDALCQLFEQGYDDDFSFIDRVIDQFIRECQIPVANDTLKMKYLNADVLKYKMRTDVDYDIFSYQYLEGLYEYLIGKVPEDHKSLDFLREMSRQHQWIKEQMQAVIEMIESQVKCTTLLKVWKHSPRSGNSFFLPAHFDRSIFTVIVHTENSGEECLRFYPPSDQVRDQEAHTPKRSDFPLLFPGAHAKQYFDLDPTLHSVVADQEGKGRYSLVFFIARFEGW